MIFEKSSFRRHAAGHEKIFVLIPGWATDARIFSTLALDGDTLIPARFSPLTFSDDLEAYLAAASVPRVSVFGWSLGVFLAADFAAKFPSRVAELCLASIRRRYEKPILDEVRAKLRRDKKAYLARFYLSFFSAAENDALAWFRKNLLEDYLSRWSLEELLGGLDYLETAELDFDSLKGFGRLRCFHGTEDVIAPFGEAREFASRFPFVDFVECPGVGHAPFLRSDFCQKLTWTKKP